jgi:hypothetical protein
MDDGPVPPQDVAHGVLMTRHRDASRDCAVWPRMGVNNPRPKDPSMAKDMRDTHRAGEEGDC